MSKYNLKSEIEFNKASYLSFMLIKEELDEIITQSTRDKTDLMLLRDKLQDYMDKTKSTLIILNIELQRGNKNER